jgi:hypothetical protein
MIEGLRMIHEEGHICFDYTGEFNEVMGKKCIDAMIEACGQAQISKALLDCMNMTGAIQIFDSFKVAEYGVKMWGVILKIALVGREDQMFTDNFVENVAINRGINLKIFTDVDEAVIWLKE